MKKHNKWSLFLIIIGLVLFIVQMVLQFVEIGRDTKWLFLVSLGFTSVGLILLIVQRLRGK